MKILRQSSDYRPNLVRQHVAALIIFIILSLLFTYPLVTCLASCARDSGDALLNAWILAWDVHKFTTDVRGIFDTNIFYPHESTLAYSESQFANAALAMPVLLLTQQPLLAHNAVLLFTFVMSAFGTYLLVHHFTGRWWAGILSGLVFAFCPYRIAHPQIQILASHWLPFTFLYFDKAMTKNKLRDHAFFVLFFNLQALSTYYYALYLVVALTAMLSVYLIVYGRSLKFLRSRLPLFVIGGILTLLINFPLARPYFELAQTGAGFERPVEMIRLFEARLTDYLTATPENWLYGDLGASFRGRFWAEHTAFPGILPVLLSLWAILMTNIRARRRRDASASNLISRARIWAYILLLLISLIMAMGLSRRLPGTDIEILLPFGWLFKYVPGFKGLRVPTRFNVMVMLALATLSGYGLHKLLAAWSFRRLRFADAISFIVCALVSLEYLAIPMVYTAQVPREPPEVYTWLANREEDAVVLELPFPIDKDTKEPDFSRLPFVAGWRVYYSTFHWKSTVNGYSGFVPPNYDMLIRDFAYFPDPVSLNRIKAMNVNYVIVHRSMYTLEDYKQLEYALSRYPDDFARRIDFDDHLVLDMNLPGSAEVRRQLGTAHFDHKLSLLGFSVDNERVTANDPLTVALLWQSQSDMVHDYTIFVHLIDQTGALVAQHDSPPRLGTLPTSDWYDGRVVYDWHVIVPPTAISSPQVEVVVGVYDASTMERLTLYDGSGNVLGDKFALLSLDVD